MSIYRDMLKNSLQQNEQDVRESRVSAGDYSYMSRMYLLLSRLKKQSNSFCFLALQGQSGTSYIVRSLIEYISMLYSRSGERALLIDGNSLNGHLSAGYNREITLGLSEIFSGINPVRAIHHDVLSSVDMIGPGVGQLFIPDSEYDKSQSMLWQLCQDYNFTVVDAPPLFSHTDAILLARYFQNVVLVCDYNVTRMKVLDRARQELVSLDINVLGAVINRQSFKIPNWLYKRI